MKAAVSRRARTWMSHMWGAARRMPSVVVILTLLYCLNVLGLMRLDSGAIYPFYLPDEAEYAVTAHNLITLHAFRFEGLFPTLIPPLYPAVLAVGRLLTGPSASTLPISTFNHLLMEAVIFPGYALARRFQIARTPAVLAAVTAAWVPNMWEAAHYLSEALYYPLFVATCLAVVVYFQRPSTKQALLVGTLLALCLLTKNSGASLLLAWALTNFAVLALAWTVEKPHIRAFASSAPFRAYLLRPLLGLSVTALLYMPWLLWRSLSLQSCAGCSGEATVFLWAVRNPDILARFVPLYAAIPLLSLGALVPPLALLGWMSALRDSKVTALTRQALFLGILIPVVVTVAATYSGYTTGQVRDRHLFLLTPALLALAGFGLQSVRRQPVRRLMLGFGLAGAAEVGVFLAGSYLYLSHVASTPWLYVVNTPWIYGLGVWATEIAHVSAPLDWSGQAFILGVLAIAVAAQLLWLLRPSARAVALYCATFVLCISSLLPVLEVLAGVNSLNREDAYYGSGDLSQWLLKEIGPGQTLTFIGCDLLSPCYNQLPVAERTTQMLAYGQSVDDIYYAEVANSYEMVAVPDLQQLPAIEARVHAAYLLSPRKLTGAPEVSHEGIVHLYDLRAFQHAGSSAAPTVRFASSLGCFAEAVTSVGPPRTMRANATTAVTVNVENASACPWSASGSNAIAISYRWRDPTGAIIGSTVSPPTALPHDLAPGQSATVTVPLVVPSEPGGATLVIDLVTYRGAGAFEAAGGTPLRLPVSIVS